MGYDRLARVLFLVIVSLFVWGDARDSVAAERTLLRWGYWVSYDPASRESLRQNAARLDIVAPGFFAMRGDGTVVGDDDAEVSRLARSGGARLVPLVRNRDQYDAFSPVLNDPDRRRSAVGNLVGLVQRHGYDGLHLDLEAINHADRPGLTALVGELAERLRPRGKLVTIALPARDREQTTGWAGAYDYAALGRISDYVVIMTYAYRTPSSTVPGSISPLPRVESAARYAASQIPPAKVLLGIGLWGYDWRVTAPTSVQSRRYLETQGLGRLHQGTYGYSEVDQSAWLRYRIGAEQHEVWFEDRRSVAAKQGVARQLGLGGTALWRLGHEDPAIWDLLAYRGPADFAIPGGRFFTQTGGGGGAGYRVVDEPHLSLSRSDRRESPRDVEPGHGRPQGAAPSGAAAGGEGVVRFWSEFVRLGGVPTLGYPISQRYVGPGGFVYQAFQRGVLQWRPEAGVAYLANTFEQLTEAGHDGHLAGLGIPEPIRDDGSSGNWPRARAIRLGWLTEPAIRQRFLANPNPSAIRDWSEDRAIELYGLPASRPVRSGPFVVQRFQRISLQLWLESVPGMPSPGSVVGILGGDYLKQLQLIPADAARPERSTPSPLPLSHGERGSSQG
ncbi:MAG: hypothetical protein HYY04_04170 [Chloroflexi bacterium]|nr:hypothetical protein [Chloroflexota bacterium]